MPPFGFAYPHACVCRVSSQPLSSHGSRTRGARWGGAPPHGPARAERGGVLSLSSRLSLSHPQPTHPKVPASELREVRAGVAPRVGTHTHMLLGAIVERELVSHRPARGASWPCAGQSNGTRGRTRTIALLQKRASPETRTLTRQERRPRGERDRARRAARGRAAAADTLWQAERARGRRHPARVALATPLPLRSV